MSPPKSDVRIIAAGIHPFGRTPGLRACNRASSRSARRSPPPV
jgi:hypothetical protein